MHIRVNHYRLQNKKIKIKIKQGANSHLFGLEAARAGRPLVAHHHDKHHEPKVQEAQQQKQKVRGIHSEQVFEGRLPFVAVARNVVAAFVGSPNAFALEAPRVIAHQHARVHLGRFGTIRRTKIKRVTNGQKTRVGRQNETRMQSRTVQQQQQQRYTICSGSSTQVEK